MSIFDVFSLVGGLALFLFGMNIMGDALEKKAGGQLKTVLSGLTSSPAKGLLLGMAVTAVIQSSSATTVMVVGFVNSGIMALRQAITVIMGANVGTTITSWILSLSGISGESFFVKMLKPTSFTPILALVGIAFYMFSKNSKKKDTGTILLGFAVLMFGMDAMSGAVAGLKDVPQFQNILLLFSNPILGVLAGAFLTAVIQSSSASVGILQALSSTGQITYSTAIPIIMGQNIGTCVTALLSSVGATKNARRAAIVHLYFNIIGTVVLLAGFYGINALIDFAFVEHHTNELGIAIVHTAFNILCTLILLPFGKQLEKLACKTIPDSKEDEKFQILDERLLATPPIAVERCRLVTEDMARISIDAMRQALSLFSNYNEEAAGKLRAAEDEVDQYEDKIGSYLVKVSAQNMTPADSAEATKLLHIIGDLERISDHSLNIVDSIEEMRDKKLSFTDIATKEISTLFQAVDEILSLSFDAISKEDIAIASLVEPLEQVVDGLKERIKTSHILRLQKNECSIEMGFILSDILTTLERVSDHCSNIAGCIIEMSHSEMDMHSYLRSIKTESQDFSEKYKEYLEKYAL